MATGFISGVVGLLGGAAFIWLLITLFSSGAIISAGGSKTLVMVGIVFAVLWLLTQKK